MSRLFSFQGRASRLEYWRVVLLCVAVSAGVILLGCGAILAIGSIAGVLFVALAPVLVVNIAAAARRLHDRDKSIWWLLVFQVAPFVAAGVAHRLAAQDEPTARLASLPFSLASLVLVVWAWVEIGFLPGKPGANRFGDLQTYDGRPSLPAPTAQP